jgi:hypothetical protein
MSNRRKPRRHMQHRHYQARYYAPDCPEPMHRLFALVGQDKISEWMDSGAPGIAHAVIFAALELPCNMHPAVIRLLHEAGHCNEKALEDPCQALHAIAEMMLPDGA